MPLSSVFLPSTRSAGGRQGVGTTFGDLHPALLTDPGRENQGDHDVERPVRVQRTGPWLVPTIRAIVVARRKPPWTPIPTQTLRMIERGPNAPPTSGAQSQPAGTATHSG